MFNQLSSNNVGWGRIYLWRHYTSTRLTMLCSWSDILRGLLVLLCQGLSFCSKIGIVDAMIAVLATSVISLHLRRKVTVHSLDKNHYYNCIWASELGPNPSW